MTQLDLDFGREPWSGYGWVIYRGRRLFALVYHTWNFWCAQVSKNPSLKRDRVGTLDQIRLDELVEPLTVRHD